jgi:hypothetical protein
VSVGPSAFPPSTDLPDESPEQGDQTEMARSRKELESQGSSRRGQAPPPQAAPPAQQAPPVQPPPQRQPLTQQDMQPGGPVFMRPQFAPPPTWRAQLRAWAQHPEANVIRRLSQRADAQNSKPGVPPQQGQQ